MIGLEILHVHPEKPNGYPPILFIHGAFHGAWSFKEHFLPFFSKHDFECIAPSLRGHGRSRLVDLRKVRFRDYVADIAQVASLFSEPPILIAHSMGATIAQGYAQHHTVSGLVLMAPMCAIPSENRFHSALHFAKNHFRAWIEMQFFKHPNALIKTADRCRTSFFSKDMPQEKVDEYFQRFQDESIPVLMQIQKRNLFTQPLRTGFPCLILEAQNDTLVHSSDIDFLCSLYGTKKELIPHMAHNMMLDVRWELAAERILSFIKHSFPKHFQR